MGVDPAKISWRKSPSTVFTADCARSSVFTLPALLCEILRAELERMNTERITPLSSTTKARTTTIATPCCPDSLLPTFVRPLRIPRTRSCKRQAPGNCRGSAH